MEKGIGDSVRPKNKFESQGESILETVVRPAMMYGAETWAVKKAQEKKLDVAEMSMLRWMSGVTKMDRIRNERIEDDESGRNIQESAGGKVEVVWARIEKRRRIGPT